MMNAIYPRALQFITMESQETSKAEKQIDRLDRLSSSGHGTSLKYAKEITCYTSKFSNNILFIGMELCILGLRSFSPERKKMCSEKLNKAKVIGCCFASSWFYSTSGAALDRCQKAEMCVCKSSDCTSWLPFCPLGFRI